MRLLVKTKVIIKDAEIDLWALSRTRCARVESVNLMAVQVLLNAFICLKKHAYRKISLLGYQNLLVRVKDVSNTCKLLKSKVSAIF